MDAEALSYPDEHFEAVIMHLIIAVMPDPQRGLAEAYRVLKPGGQLCVMDKFQPDGQPAGAGRRLLNGVTSALATDIYPPSTATAQRSWVSDSPRRTGAHEWSIPCITSRQDRSLAAKRVTFYRYTQASGC